MIYNYCRLKYMRRVIVSFVFIIVSMLASAQLTYSIYYEHFKNVQYSQGNYVTALTNNSRLVFNDSISLFYFFSKDLKDNFRKRKTIGSELMHHAVFYDSKNFKLYDEVSWPKRKEHLMERKLPYYNWVFTGETKQILNYNCSKAVSSAQDGQDSLSVWYTSEIKRGFGPVYYFGLPGVVLEVNNYNTDKSIKAISVDTNKVTLLPPDNFLQVLK